MDHPKGLLPKDAGDALDGKGRGQRPVDLDTFGLHVEDLKVVPFSHVMGAFHVANMPSAVSAVIAFMTVFTVMAVVAIPTPFICRVHFRPL